MEGKRKKYCKFPGCNNAYITGGGNKHYFQFPKDPEVHRRWKEICSVKESTGSSNFVICEDHFRNTDFVNENKQRLKPGTVPFVQCSDIAKNLLCPCFNTPSTSSTVCTCESSHTESLGEVTCNIDIQDHDYFVRDFVDVPQKFAFLNEGSKGILGKIGLSKKDLSPTKNLMYKIHRSTTAKFSKLKSLLENEREKVKTLSDLYKNDRFAFLENELNFVTKEFVDSQLRNCNRKPHARRWSNQDKAFVLSIYKESTFV